MIKYNYDVSKQNQKIVKNHIFIISNRAEIIRYLAWNQIIRN